jgi:hypothetical protein
VNAAELCKTQELPFPEQFGLSLRKAIHSFSTDSVENRLAVFLIGGVSAGVELEITFADELLAVGDPSVEKQTSALTRRH